MLSKGKKVYYITGNHDEMLRKFQGFKLGEFEIVNKLVLEFNGRKAWFFHGDVFDVTMKNSRWLAKLGGWGYDLLIMINTMVNWISSVFGKGRISLSKRIKNSVEFIWGCIKKLKHRYGLSNNWIDMYYFRLIFKINFITFSWYFNK